MYKIELMPKAMKDLKGLPKQDANKIIEKIRIEKSGKKEFVILPYEEYQAILALMDDYEDLKDLRAAKKASKGEKGIPLDKAINKLGI